MLSRLRDPGLDLQSLFLIRIGDGSRTCFWHDVWKGDDLLVITFHRKYDLDTYRSATVLDRTLLGWNTEVLR